MLSAWIYMVPLVSRVATLLPAIGRQQVHLLLHSTHRQIVMSAWICMVPLVSRVAAAAAA
jgi:hypothetical protein